MILSAGPVLLSLTIGALFAAGAVVVTVGVGVGVGAGVGVMPSTLIVCIYSLLIAVFEVESIAVNLI